MVKSNTYSYNYLVWEKASWTYCWLQTITIQVMTQKMQLLFKVELEAVGGIQI